MIRSEDDYPNRGGGYDFGERAYRITSRERRDQSRVRDGQRSRRLDANTNRSVPPREKMRISNKDFIRRRNWLQFIGAIAVVVLVSRLAWVQLVWGPDFAAKAVAQRSRVYIDSARRGEIVDRNGQRLAYTMKSRSLTVSPTRLRDELREQEELEATGEAYFDGLDDAARKKFLDDKLEERLKEMAKGIPSKIKDAGLDTGDVDEQQILDKLRADTQYEVLVRNVDPDVAVKIASEYHGLAADEQQIRQYPNGSIAENVIGKVSMDGQGQFGFEASGDSTLTGIDGSST